MANPSKTQSASRARLRKGMNWLIRLRGSPQAIAGGVAVGLIVAFTPTVGFQIPLALGLATLLGANRAVAIVPVWITNPITVPPIYGFTYYLGNYFWAGPAPSAVARAMADVAKGLESLDFLAFREQFASFMALGADVFIAMWIGGLLVGFFAAAIAYPLTVRAVTQLRAQRAWRKRRRAARRRAAVAATASASPGPGASEPSES